MKKIIPFACLGILFAAPAAMADTLLLDKIREGIQQHEAKPLRGMDMRQVAERFGEPQERVAPVGEPAISRWVYTGYTVYFEGDRVIHSVGQR